MLFVVADAEVVTGTQRFRIQSVSSNCNGVLCMGGPGLYHAMPLDYIPPAPSAADMLDIVQAASMVYPSLCSTEQGSNVTSGVLTASASWAEALKDSMHPFDEAANVSVAWAHVLEELCSGCTQSFDSLEGVDCIAAGSAWQQLAEGIGNTSRIWLTLIEEKAELDHLPMVVKVSEAWADVFFRMRDMHTAVLANLPDACSEAEEVEVVQFLAQQDEALTTVASAWVAMLEDFCEMDCRESLRLWSQLETRLHLLMAYDATDLEQVGKETLDALVEKDPGARGLAMAPPDSMTASDGVEAPPSIHLKSRVHDQLHGITAFSYDISCTLKDVAWLGLFLEPDLEVDQERTAPYALMSSTFNGRNIVKLHVAEVQLCSIEAVTVAFQGDMGICRGQAMVVSKRGTETLLPVPVPCRASSKINGFTLPVSHVLPPTAASRAATTRADDFRTTTTTVTYLVAREGSRAAATTSSWGSVSSKLQQLLDELRALQSMVRQAEHCVDLEDLINRLVEISATSVSTFTVEALRPQVWDDGSYAYAVSSRVAETFAVITQQWALRPGCVNAVAGIVSAMQASSSSWQRVFTVHGSSSKDAAMLTSAKWAEAFKAAGIAWKELATKEDACSKTSRWAVAMSSITAHTATAQTSWSSHLAAVVDGATEDTAAKWSQTWASVVQAHLEVSRVWSQNCAALHVPVKQKEAAERVAATVSSRLLDATYELVSKSSLSTWMDMTQLKHVPGAQWHRCSDTTSLKEAAPEQRQLVYWHCARSTY